MVTSGPTWLWELPTALYALYAGVFGWGLVLCLIVGVAMTGGNAAVLPHHSLVQRNGHGEELAKSATSTTTPAMEGYLAHLFLATPAVLLLIATQFDVIIRLVSDSHDGSAELQSYVSALANEYSISLMTDGFTMISGILLLACVSRLSLVVLSRMSIAGRAARASWIVFDAIDACVCLSACFVEWFVRAPLVDTLQASLDVRVTGRPMRPWELSTAASHHDDLTPWNNLLTAHAVVMLFLQMKRMRTKPNCSAAPVDPVAIASACDTGAAMENTNDQMRTTTTRIANADCWTTVESDQNASEKECGKKTAFTVGVQTMSESVSMSCDTAVEQLKSADVPVSVTPIGLVVAEGNVKLDSLKKSEADVSLQLEETIDEPKHLAKRRKTNAACDDVKEACTSESNAGRHDGASDGASDGETNKCDQVIHANLEPIIENTEEEVSADTSETKATASNKTRKDDDDTAKVTTSPRKAPSSKQMMPEPSAAPDTREDIVTDAMFGICAAAGVMLLLGGTRRLLQRR